MNDNSPDALKLLYTDWMARMTADPAMPLDQIRNLFEHWGDVTAEPGGVDYIEDVVGGIHALWAKPKDRDTDRTLLCFHGGGYVLGSMYSHRKLYGHFAKAAGCAALIVNYTRAPENPHPGPVNDCAAAYAGLVQDRNADPSKIAFVGDSAGGALALTTLLRARELGLPLPAAAMAMAPYLDLEATGGTYATNDAVDALGARDGTLKFVEVFLGPDGNRHDPLASPLYADLTGLPPILIQTGGDDVLLDDSRRFHLLAQAAGLDVTLEVSDGQQHVFHFLAGAATEADAAIGRAGHWLRGKLE
jgi:epsilon-lactone hydrolase